MKLPRAFYTRTDVVQVAKELLGKVLITRLDGIHTAGIITETEAYEGETDKACHAYGGRRTKRTETMYQQGGTAYVYLCYGIHHLFNVVTHTEGTPHAVLVRGVQPLEGVEEMKVRRNKSKVNKNFSAGPGTMSQAMGITTQLDEQDLIGNTIWIEDRGMEVPDSNIHITPRIGVDYAGEDAKRPYRFVINSKGLR